MDVTREIYNQLGGKLFLLYSGCKNILRDTEKNTLRMTLPKNQSGANRLEIIYNAGKDTYTQLLEIYTEITGISLPYRVVFG